MSDAPVTTPAAEEVEVDAVAAEEGAVGTGAGAGAGAGTADGAAVAGEAAAGAPAGEGEGEDVMAALLAGVAEHGIDLDPEDLKTLVSSMVAGGALDFSRLIGADDSPADGAGAAEPEVKNLWTAASDGDSKFVEELVASGQSVNAQDDHGYSTLHAAVGYGHTELLQWLLAHGGSVGLKDIDGDTPLHACESVDCAKELLRAGAALDALNLTGQTPLDVAIQEEREEMVAFLRHADAPSGSGPVAPEATPDDDLFEEAKVSSPTPPEDMDPSSVVEYGAAVVDDADTEAAVSDDAAPEEPLGSEDTP